jgi:hypothetical protein
VKFGGDVHGSVEEVSSLHYVVIVRQHDMDVAERPIRPRREVALRRQQLHRIRIFSSLVNAFSIEVADANIADSTYSAGDCSTLDSSF